MPSPQVVYAIVDQLVNVAGVPAQAITIYDASRRIGNPIYDKIRGKSDFRDIRFVCNTTADGRSGATYDAANPVCFGNRSIARAYLPRCVTEAKYLINMALLRAHSLFGVTVCGKNHFGSTYFSGNGWTPSPLHNYGTRTNAMATYNCLVDLIGHAHLGGKTLLYLIDGLYSARNQSADVIRYASFGDDWCSSLFASQDPIAIDSVALDFIRNEPRATDCTGRGVDNYLHEAALANDPPSGTFYDPEGDGVGLQSLGVHEHWNNPTDKQYSRNLGLDEGIELVTPGLTSENGPVRNSAKGTRYDFVRYAVRDAHDGDEIVVSPGTYRETVDFADKDLVLRSEEPNDPAVVAATTVDGGTQAVIVAGGQGPDCVLAGLTLTGAACGLYCDGASPTILNCRITGNDEAGIKMGEGCNPTIANCIVSKNGGPGIDMKAPRGGRFITYNKATIAHCTIVDNAGEGVAGDDPVIVNSILYGNGSDQSFQIDCRAPIVNYCNVEGGCPGVGNMDVDPAFVAPGDYHLLPTSACIDAGDPDFVLDAIATDIDGTARVQGDRADIGCDEFAEEVPE
jgi:parallel beta-helix repeat protein